MDKRRLRELELFQSTLPLRGATSESLRCLENILISIHAPLTGSDPKLCRSPPSEHISIHAPLTGSDVVQTHKLNTKRISIHAPLTGSDSYSIPDSLPQRNFNPRSPYGERPARQSC